MKEEKFRAWNIKTKTMVDLKKITPLILNIDVNGLFLPFSDDLMLMQFTGLLDKDKRDIYEGDIIEIKSQLSERISRDEIIWWRDGFKTKVGGQIPKETRIKVIGNIWENSELLEHN